MARAARTGPWTAVPPQHGRRFVVTGASGGIGLETTRRLVPAGAHVVLAVRDPEKGERVAAPLRASLVGSVEVARLDVADLSSVRAFADAVGPVDVLVNNAGVLGLPFSRTVDGFETQLATNHLGHFALTNLLLPRLTDRVVVVASASHRGGDLDVTDLDWSRRGYRPYAAYAASKLANLLFVAELQRRLTAAGSTLRVTAAHPGYTSTGIQGGTGNAAFTRLAQVGNALLGMPAWQGALPTLYAATMDLPGNSYVGPHRARELNGWPTLVGRSRTASDPDLARELWAASERLTGVAWALGGPG
ncbi:SDR family NAD(P)-dependent oxidoreductase [Nocardioides sp. KIGAM211]|uniref:SDR family NAD(P)-dependent oxidoreductase n=1 Tax=Nocardioides luti TaxID=2761101 RepID=A0A7X0RCM7_9ACTN|nr:SDR family NAD(P)-dependent oxidoreductase [Nocardioides luti]